MGFSIDRLASPWVSAGIGAVVGLAIGIVAAVIVLEVPRTGLSDRLVWGMAVSLGLLVGALAGAAFGWALRERKW